MKLVIQRVSRASVEVEGQIVGRIDAGLMILVGVDVEDTESDVEFLANKTAALRIFNDHAGVMNRSVVEAGGGVLAVSQFTLLANARKGNRPSYIRAARPEKALPLYNLYCEKVAQLIGKPVERGIFGADMKVELCNDGPVTILIDSRQ